MGNTLKFDLTEVELLEDNLLRICRRAKVKFPNYYEAGYLRLYLPEYVISLLKLYAENKFMSKQLRFEEGVSEFCGVKMYYNIVDKISIGLLSFHYPETGNGSLVMTNFLTDKPIFE